MDGRNGTPPCENQLPGPVSEDGSEDGAPFAADEYAGIEAE